MAEEDYVPCQVVDNGCPCTFQTDSKLSLLSHYRTCHRNDQNFAVPCIFSDCQHTHLFRTEDGLRKHLDYHHPQFFIKNRQVNDGFVQQDLGQETDCHTEFTPNLQASTSISPTPLASLDVQPSTTGSDDSQMTSNQCLNTVDPPMYILGLLAERKLTQVDLKSVMKWTNIYVNNAVATTLDDVVTTLGHEGCGDSYVDSVKKMRQIFTDQNAAPDPFEGLKTEYMQRKYFCQHYGLIEPIKFVLPETPEDYRRVFTNESQQKKEKSYAIVPLFPQIEALLNKFDVHHQVYGEKSRLPGTLSRFEHGSAYVESPFFQAHPKALQIHLYIDEVQMVDNLGSKTLGGKMVFVYFTLGNLESKFRSCLKHINLLSIFPNEHVATYGLNLLLKPIVDDLKKLEEGIDLTIFGKTVKVFGTLAVLIADNLASHAVGGFKCGFSRGFRKCRYCLGTDEQIQSFSSDGNFCARNKTEHDAQCEGLDTTLAEHFGKLYGLNGRSILNELKYFHVIGGLVPDIMHDLHEGVLGRILVHVLKYCIKEAKFFNLSELNRAVQNFKYGHMEVKDKPSIILDSHLDNNKLRQSAAQIALLANILPLCVGPLIPEGDETWWCLTTTVEILRILLQNSITQLEIAKLEFLIVDLFTSFKECFPHLRITPKMHFLIHYPRHIRMMGPLNAFWCMRYEAKHSYFKKMSRSIGNFINLPMTLSYRHQYFQCFNLVNSGPNFLINEIESPKRKKVISIKDCLCEGQIRCLLLNDDDKAKIRDLPWIRHGSTIFKATKNLNSKSKNKKKAFCSNTFVLCPLRGSIDGEFGKIVKIYEFENKQFFVCEMYRVLQFNSHFQAFRVIKRKDKLKMVLQYDDLLDHRVYHRHNPVQIDPDSPNLHHEYIIPRCDFEHKSTV